MTHHMRLSRTLVSALALLAASSCLAAASTLSKAVRTSESMEPALAFPAQEQAAQAKLDALRARTGKRPEHRLAGRRRHGLWRSRRLRRRRGGRRGDAEHGPAGARGPEAHLDLFAADLHADALGDPDRPAAGAHRPDPADPGRRQASPRTPGPTRSRCRSCSARPATRPCCRASGMSARPRACGRTTSASTSSTASTRPRRRSARASTSAAIPTWCSIPSGWRCCARPARAPPGARLQGRRDDRGREDRQHREDGRRRPAC